MRKLVDTMVLVLLLLGPAVVLTCVRQPEVSHEKMSKSDLPDNNLQLAAMGVDLTTLARP